MSALKNPACHDDLLNYRLKRSSRSSAGYNLIVIFSEYYPRVVSCEYNTKVLFCSDG